jgi:hypothetical protein
MIIMIKSTKRQIFLMEIQCDFCKVEVNFVIFAKYIYIYLERERERVTEREREWQRESDRERVTEREWQRESDRERAREVHVTWKSMFNLLPSIPSGCAKLHYILQR